MTSIQRWTLDYPESDGGEWILAMLKHSDGEYVLHADHARVVAELVEAHEQALAEARDEVLALRFTEFMAAIKKSCPCICHEYTRDINPHDDKCVCNGGTGMETL